MNFDVRSICGKYQEVKVDEIDSGTLDTKEAIELAKNMIDAAEDLLWGADMKASSDACGRLLSDLSEHL